MRQGSRTDIYTNTRTHVLAHTHTGGSGGGGRGRQSQWVSEVTIKGPAGTDISEEDVRNLTFNLPKEEKRQVLATTDDIMEDLRLVYRVVRLFAKKAGVTKAEIEPAEQASDSE